MHLHASLMPEFNALLAPWGFDGPMRCILVLLLVLAGASARAENADSMNLRIAAPAENPRLFATAGEIAARLSRPPGSPPCRVPARCGIDGLIATAVTIDRLKRIDASWPFAGIDAVLLDDATAKAIAKRGSQGLGAVMDLGGDGRTAIWLLLSPTIDPTLASRLREALSTA